MRTYIPLVIEESVYPNFEPGASSKFSKTLALNFHRKGLRLHKPMNKGPLENQL
jgi:hypothetical protein